jgi:hypothetical protein
MSDPTPSSRARERVEAWAFSGLGAALLLTQIGYAFESGDQQQYLLLPYREIHPAFLPGDWFTWSTTHYHHSYAWLIRALHAVAGDAGLSWAVFACNLVVLCGLAGGILAWSRAWGFGLSRAATVLVILAMVRPVAAGAATFSHKELLPADMALPPLLFALAAWHERRPLACGLWLGLSAFLHPNFAVLGGMVLFPLAAWDAWQTRVWRPLVVTALAYALLAAPTLVLIVRSFLVGDAAPEAMWLVFRVRAPHHYDLAGMAPEDFAWPALLFVAGLPAWLSGRWDAGHRRNRWVLWVVLGILALGLVGSVSGVLALVRLFVWRLTVPLCLLLLLVAAEVAWRAFAARDAPLCWWVVAVAGVAATFVRSDLADVASWALPRAAFALPALVPLAIAGVLLTRESRRARGFAVAIAVVPIAWSTGVALTPLSVEWRRDREFEAVVRGPRLAPIAIEPKLGKWLARIRDETPAYARFLIPPSLGDFRLGARRGVYVDWKCIPMRGEEALEWKRRMLNALGVAELPGTGYELRRRAEAIYEARPLAELEAVARREGLQYVVANKHAASIAGLERWIAGAKWRVYRVRTAEETRMQERILRFRARRALGLPGREPP